MMTTRGLRSLPLMSNSRRFLKDEFLQGVPLDPLDPVSIFPLQLHAHERGHERQDLLGLFRVDCPDGPVQLFESFTFRVLLGNPGPLFQKVDKRMEAQVSANGDGPALQDRDFFHHLAVLQFGDQAGLADARLADDVHY